jgi:AraC-like DNA-binding protein
MTIAWRLDETENGTMSSATPRLSFTPNAQTRHPKTRVWRPFPREVADIVGIENHGGDMQMRMHPWFAISLVRSRTLVTVESKRDVVADRHSVILIPPFQLYGLRAQGEPGQGAVTLLLRGSHLEGLGFPAHAALATDPVLGEQTAALMSRLLPPVVSVEHATTTRSVLEQLVARSSPLAANRARRTSPLVPVRAYLKANVNESVPTENVARISGLSEHQVIRAFHYEFGLPPHAYHLRVRLAAACEMLTSGLPVARVANEFGFADQSHLSRRFKSVYGVTPAAWAAGSAGGRGYDAGMPTRAIHAPAKQTSVSFQRTGRAMQEGL